MYRRLVRDFSHLNDLNPYFIGLPILMGKELADLVEFFNYLNPYFIGLPILIGREMTISHTLSGSQSLFYWITYSYPFCRESPLFIIATEFFSDIKIDFFLIFLVIFF